MCLHYMCALVLCVYVCVRVLPFTIATMSLPSSPPLSFLSLDSSGVFYSDATDSWQEVMPADDVVVGVPLGSLVVNVGGCRYLLSQDLLASHPETRLGRLARSGPDSALELCDDADLPGNEFFFDRSSQTFQ